MDRVSADIGVGKPGLVLPYRVLSVVTVLLVVLQAILAGQGWFEDRDIFDIHEMVGNLFFLVVVAQLVLTWLLGIEGKFGRQMLRMNVALLILTVVQIALGYAAEDTTQAGAWHVPNALLLFGLSASIARLSFQLRDRS